MSSLAKLHTLPAASAPALLAILALLALGCSCSGRTSGDGEADDALPDDGAFDGTDVQNDDGVDPDPLEDPQDIDGGDGDAPDDCFLPFGEGYDVASLGLEVIPRWYAPVECGECCRQVSFSRADLTFPIALDVWGRYLVYSTMETYCGDDCMSRIVLTDLANGSEYLIDSRDADPPDTTIVTEQVRYPALYTDTVYYTHGRTIDTGTERIVQCEIIRFSLTTGETDVVHAFETPCEHNCWCPDELDAYDNYLVWQDNRDGMGGMQKVRLLDLTSGIETTISDWLVLNPTIWGRMVIYDSYPTNPQTINRFDIETSFTTIYTDGEHDRWNGDIWQNLITWSDARAGGNQADQAFADIYMMDMVTGVETAVCTHPASQFGSFVFGDLIVWTDLRDDPDNPNNYPAADNWNVYGYRISTGEEMQLTDLPGKEWVMELHDNHVFFLMDDGTGVENIFMRDVPF